MKRMLLTVLCVTVLASPAFAQWGNIAVFEDDQGLSCSITDNVSGLKHVFILHVNNQQGVKGSAFMIQETAGSTLQWLSATPLGTPTFLVIGDAHAAPGIIVAYAQCIATPSFPILDCSYFAAGTSAACSRIQIVPAPNTAQGEVLVIDCSDAEQVQPQNGQAIINEDGTCMCNVPVQESTWGKVKALYR